MRTAPIATILSLVSVDTAALACNDESREAQVIGVARDGRFLTRHIFSYGGSEGGPTVIDVLRSADGSVETIEPDRASIGLEGARALTTPRRTPTQLEVTPVADDPSACAISAQTPEGPVLLTAIDFTSGANKGLRCSDVRAELWRHRQSRLAFVELSFATNESSDGGCSLGVTDVTWVPEARIEAGRAFLRATARTAKGEDATVIALEKIIRADPGLLSARLALAQLLSKRGVAWEDARADLSIPFPEGTLPTFAANPDSYIGALRGLWEEPAYDAWLASHEEALAARFSEMSAAHDVR